MDLFENKEFLAALDELSKVSDVFVDHENKKIRVDCRTNHVPLTEKTLREDVEYILGRNKLHGFPSKEIRYETNDGRTVAVWTKKDGFIPENIARLVAEDQEL